MSYDMYTLCWYIPEGVIQFGYNVIDVCIIVGFNYPNTGIVNNTNLYFDKLTDHFCLLEWCLPFCWMIISLRLGENHHIYQNLVNGSETFNTKTNL